MTGDHVVHSITTTRGYYVIQVGRTLEVRARDTHVVLQVLQPPAEWGDDWLWSCCGYDGLRCVSVDEIRFLKANLKGSSAKGTTAPEDGERPGTDAPSSETEREAGPPDPGKPASLAEPSASSPDRHNEYKGESCASSGQDGDPAACEPLHFVV